MGTVRTARRFSSREEWMAARKALPGYGASAVSAILGPKHNPYASRFEVWARKTGRMEPQPVNEAMESGQYAEMGWLKWYADREREAMSPTCDPMPVLVEHPADELAYCSPDGLVVADSAADSYSRIQITPTGALARGPVTMSAATLPILKGVDAKNHSAHILQLEPGVTGYGEQHTDVVPRYVWWQCQWSCYVCGVDQWDVAAVFGGQKLRVFHVRRSDRAIEAAAEAVRVFHERHVLADEPPHESARGLARIEKSLKQLWPKASGPALVATQADLEMADRLHLAQRGRSMFQSIEDAYKAWFIRRMEQHPELRLGSTDGPVLLTYKGGGEPDEVVDWEATAKAYEEKLSDLGHPGTIRETKPGKKKARTLLPKMNTDPDKRGKLLSKAHSLGYDPVNQLDGVTWAIDESVSALEPQDEEKNDDE